MPWQIRVAIADDTGLIGSLPLNSDWPVGRIGDEFEKSRLHFRLSRNRDSVQFTGKQMAIAQKHVGTAKREVELKRTSCILRYLEAGDQEAATPNKIFL